MEINTIRRIFTAGLNQVWSLRPSNRASEQRANVFNNGSSGGNGGSGRSGGGSTKIAGI